MHLRSVRELARQGVRGSGGGPFATSGSRKHQGGSHLHMQPSLWATLSFAWVSGFWKRNGAKEGLPRKYGVVLTASVRALSLVPSTPTGGTQARGSAGPCWLWGVRVLLAWDD